MKKTATKKCDCMAQLHSLINNCLGCGRVVCSLEGEGSCSFCGNLVLKPENMNDIEESERIMKELELDPALSNSYFVAIEHKSKLVDQDRDKRTTRNVIDEDADWYEIKSDVWQSDEVRKNAMNMMLVQEDEERYVKDNELSAFDFKAGKVQSIKMKVDTDKHKQLVNEMLQKDLEEQNLEDKMMKFEADRRLQEMDRQVLAQMKDVYQSKLDNKQKPETGLPKQPKLATKVDNDDCYETFVKAMEAQSKIAEDDETQYDRPFFRLTADDNKCLSMWQPWASLLIYGFKRFEGRQWDTNYRGPLWIHAGSRQPDPSEIRKVENQYRKLYEGQNMPPFPTSYPTGCVIGLVDLQDVISQQMYTEYIPKEFTGESTEDWLFVIRNPRRLMVNIKCVGNKNIFNLDPAVITAAAKTLKKVPSSWFPYYADKLPTKKQSDKDQQVIEEQEQVVAVNAKKVEKPKCFTVVEAEPIEGMVHLRLDKRIEELLKAFLNGFEKSISKKLEKGKEGLRCQVDQSMVNSDKLIQVLQGIQQDLYDLSKENAEKVMPRSMDIFSVTKNTKAFPLPRDYCLVLVLGKGVDFSGKPSKQLPVKNLEVLASPTYSAPISELSFAKVGKNVVPISESIQSLSNDGSLMLCFC